jgi:serine/threonine-protein kinase RsbT
MLAEAYQLPNELRIPIDNEADIVAARQEGRQLAAERGFSRTEQTLIATAISEVARNIIEYARRGEILLCGIEQRGRSGIQVIARDDGPGIQDINLAMRDGWSTAKSLGMGLPGARRLMDEFDLVSAPGKGTLIKMAKWVR